MSLLHPKQIEWQNGINKPPVEAQSEEHEQSNELHEKSENVEYTMLIHNLGEVVEGVYDAEIKACPVGILHECILVFYLHLYDRIIEKSFLEAKRSGKYYP